MKTALKNTIWSFILLTFFMSTTGISIVEHYCSHTHEHFYFVYHTHPSCNDLDPEHHHHGNEVVHQHSSSEHLDDHCCSNTERFFKIINSFVAQNNDNELSTPVIALYSDPMDQALVACQSTELSSFDNKGDPSPYHNPLFIRFEQFRL